MPATAQPVQVPQIVRLPARAACWPCSSSAALHHAQREACDAQRPAAAVQYRNSVHEMTAHVGPTHFRFLNSARANSLAPPAPLQLRLLANLALRFEFFPAHFCYCSALPFCAVPLPLMRKAPKGAPTPASGLLVPNTASHTQQNQTEAPPHTPRSLSHESSVQKIPIASAASPQACTSSIASTSAEAALVSGASAASAAPSPSTSYSNRKPRELSSQRSRSDKGSANGAVRPADVATIALAPKAAAVKFEPLVSLKGEVCANLMCVRRCV